jgi:hypothetical protein
LFFSGVTFTPEFSFASATGAAKCFQGFEDFQNARWLGAGELFGEIGRHDGNLCGGSAIGQGDYWRGLRSGGLPDASGTASKVRCYGQTSKHGG